MSHELKRDETIELINCALQASGTLRPWSRDRRRVCEHLIGKRLLEAVKQNNVWNDQHYPAVMPSLRPGAAVRLTKAGKLAICSLPCVDMSDIYPLARDIQRAKQICGCPDADDDTQPGAPVGRANDDD